MCSATLYLILVCCTHICIQKIQEVNFSSSRSAYLISLLCQGNSHVKGLHSDQGLDHAKNPQNCECCFDNVQLSKVQDEQSFNIHFDYTSQNYIDHYIIVNNLHGPETSFYHRYKHPPPSLNGTEKRKSIQSFLL